MCRRAALGSGDRRGRAGHDHHHPASILATARSWRAAALAAAALALAACASSPPTRSTPALSVPAEPAESPPPLAADPRVLMIDAATAMLGQPYLWGGAAPGGFDCSGLVYYSAAGAGIKVPRTAQEQLNSGIPITRDEVRAGDLVFMHLDRKDLHVGIAVSNERFIHAPSSGAHVRIDSLDAAPYARAYLGARRIIAAAP